MAIAKICDNDDDDDCLKCVHEISTNNIIAAREGQKAIDGKTGIAFFFLMIQLKSSL